MKLYHYWYAKTGEYCGVARSLREDEVTGGDFVHLEFEAPDPPAAMPKPKEPELPDGVYLAENLKSTPCIVIIKRGEAYDPHGERVPRSCLSNLEPLGGTK